MFFTKIYVIRLKEKTTQIGFPTFKLPPITVLKIC